MKSFSEYSNEIMELRYSHVVQGRKESWEQIARRVTQEICRGKERLAKLGIRYSKELSDAIQEAIISRKLIPGGRQLSQAGRSYHQTDNCFMLRAKDTREGWAEIAHKTTMMFMSGGGVGVSYDELRPYGSQLKRSGGISSGPIPLIEMVNGIGAAARQGGERRGAIYASLKWDHQDIEKFIELKINGGLEHTNISVRFDEKGLVDTQVFKETLRNACRFGDPGFQFDWDNQVLRNACTEVISEDDCDSCCLASVNLSQIKDLNELSDITQLGVVYLLLATLYTDVPVPEVRVVKDKNRRLGLGLMGVGEWFIQRKLPYGSLRQEGQSNFGNWLMVYKQASEYASEFYSKEFGLNKPIAVRAIAPTGTISIAGGLTTPGIEPVFHTAYLRTYNTLKSQEYQDGLRTEKVIDPVVSKWIEEGHSVENIDTAWSLSRSTAGIERRIAFQAFVQEFVDNGISSTVNLPSYQEGIEDEIGPILIKYLPRLRGITFYPDGRYENQPVVPIELSEVLGKKDVVTEQYESCKGGVCGI